MSSAKAALKAINDAIRGQDYDSAVDKAKELVKKEPKSYQGLVCHFYHFSERLLIISALYSWPLRWTKRTSLTKRRNFIRRLLNYAPAMLKPFKD